MNGITAEMLKSGADVVAEWIHKICFGKKGRVPDDWTGTVIVPLYKGKVCMNVKITEESVY